ncbi:MAG: hypothetical protein F6K17_39340, partial [Okeania sp. SIO3C4]|nr:hypothetical protein [Okeania sp. SIO3C4]
MHLRLLRNLILLVILLGVYFALAYLKLLPKSLNAFELALLSPINKSIVVKEVKEIGELTTAQFYGEVFADLNSVQASFCEQYPTGDFPDSISEDFPGLKKYAQDYIAYKTVDSVRMVRKIQSRNLEQLIDTMRIKYRNNQNNFISKEAKQKAAQNINNKSLELKAIRKDLPALERQSGLAKKK